MLPPFGFSVGDFVAGIQLIRQLISALEDSAGSSAEYRGLIKELYSLERALLEVKHLDLDDSQHAQFVALRQAATQCQQTIDEFLLRIRKFQPSLRKGGSKSSWRDGLRKVEWALYKKDDVERFRAQLNGHTASINILLMTVHLQTSTVQSRKLSQQQEDGDQRDDQIARNNERIQANQQILNTHTDLILTLTKIATNAATHEHTQDLKELMLKILKTNLQIYDMVINIQSTLPQQVERERPVLFLDACGRLSPVHLEFITSTEAFLAVLKVRFKDTGLQKIEKGQFVLEEARTKRQVDLRRPWHMCFLPGQKIDMSMLFSLTTTATPTCPGCQHESLGDPAMDVECTNCGLQYRRLRDVEEVKPSTGDLLWDEQLPTTPTVLQISRKRKFAGTTQQSSLPYADDTQDWESDREDEIHLFRRVHVKARKGVSWSPTNKHSSLYLTRKNGVRLDSGHLMAPSRSITSKAVAVHANRPFDQRFYYFEIEIISGGFSDEGDGILAIGICTSKQLDQMPGMSPNSWGYHSDDGCTFACVKSKTYRKTPYGSRWSTGDIIGCGWDPGHNYIWFTLNGVFLGQYYFNWGKTYTLTITHAGVAYKNIVSSSLYPTVSTGWRTGDVDIVANFGATPFTYDLDMHRLRNNDPTDGHDFGRKKVIDKHMRDRHWNIVSNPDCSSHDIERQSFPSSTEHHPSLGNFPIPSGNIDHYTPHFNSPSVGTQTFHTTLFDDGSTDEIVGFSGRTSENPRAEDRIWPILFAEADATAGLDEIWDLREYPDPMPEILAYVPESPGSKFMPEYRTYMPAYGTSMRSIDDKSAMARTVTSHQSTDDAVEFEPEMSNDKEQHMISDSSPKETNQSEWNPTALFEYVDV